MLGNAFNAFNAGVSAVGVWRCNNRPPPAARRGGSGARRLAPGGWRPAAGARRPGTVLGLMGFMWGTEDHGAATRMDASGSNDAVSPICQY